MILIFQKVPKLPENDLEKLVDEFKKCLLSLPTDENPLLLVLDSLDQLVGEIVYDFLPTILPKYVINYNNIKFFIVYIIFNNYKEKKN